MRGTRWSRSRRGTIASSTVSDFLLVFLPRLTWFPELCIVLRDAISSAQHLEVECLVQKYCYCGSLDFFFCPEVHDTDAKSAYSFCSVPAVFATWHLHESEHGHKLPAFFLDLSSKNEWEHRTRYLSEPLYSAATRFGHNSRYAWLVDAVVLLYVNRPETWSFPGPPSPTAEFAIRYLESFV